MQTTLCHLLWSNSLLCQYVHCSYSLCLHELGLFINISLKVGMSGLLFIIDLNQFHVMSVIVNVNIILKP